MRRRKLLTVALLAFALAAGVGSARAAAADEAVITVHHSRFVPGAMSFEKGDTVTFVLVNTDPIDHEFILGDEEVQDRHEFGTEAHHDAIPTEISLPAGATVRTTVTFDEPGELIIGCHLPGHYRYGMRAQVTVRG